MLVRSKRLNKTASKNMIKTNKSYTKRLKLTKKGKLLGRKAGQNHFNAKENNMAKGAKKHMSEFHMTNKSRTRFLAGF